MNYPNFFRLWYTPIKLYKCCHITDAYVVRMSAAKLRELGHTLDNDRTARTSMEPADRPYCIPNYRKFEKKGTVANVAMIYAEKCRAFHSHNRKRRHSTKTVCFA